MKRTLVVVSIVALLVTAGAVVAQERMHMNEMTEITDALQLTPAQLSVWQSAHAEFRDATRPLMEKQHAIGQQIEAQLKSNSADACTLGGELIAQHAVNDQVRAAHEALKAKLAATLTPEQKTKFEAIATMHERHGGPMHEAHE